MWIHIFYANVPGTATHAINYRGTITVGCRETAHGKPHFMGQGYERVPGFEDPGNFPATGNARTALTLSQVHACCPTLQNPLCRHCLLKIQKIIKAFESFNGQ